MAEFLNGEHSELLSYEKTKNSKSDGLSALHKYLVLAGAFVEFNTRISQYYDIYRTCRGTHIICSLAASLALIHRLPNVNKLIRKMVNAKTFDEFDSIHFEAAVAARYVESGCSIEFIDSSEEIAPEFRVIILGSTLHVECKRINRQSDLSIKIRNYLRSVTDLPSKYFYSKNQSLHFELDIVGDPLTITSQDLLFASLDASRKSYRSKLYFGKFWLKCIPATMSPLETYTLHPSVKYYRDRYNFSEQDGWGGLVEKLECQYAFMKGGGPFSTWMDKVNWEYAVKWRISDPDTIDRLQKINFNRLKKAYEQVSSRNTPGIIHFCFERDASLGHRADKLKNLVEKVFLRDVFDYKIPLLLIFNELEYEVTYQGQIDVREHAHYTGNFKVSHEDIPVTNVFTKSVDPSEIEQYGKFGEGNKLIGLDDKD